MQTIKTAAVTVLLLTVLYGAYVAINTPPATMPDELQAIVEEGSLNIDSGDISVPEIEVPDFNTFAGTTSEEGITATISSNDGATGSIGSNSPATVDNVPAENNGIANTPPSISYGQSEPNSATSADLTQPNSSDFAGASPILTAPLPKPNSSDALPVADPDASYPKTELADELTGLSLSGPVSAQTPAPADASAPPAGGFSMPDSSSSDQALNAPPTPDPVSPAAETASGFDNAITTADGQVSKGQWKEALYTLSLFYGSPDLSSEQLAQLMPRLNALAGEVIYSRKHLIESAHRVGPGETLQSIAAARKVPWQVLANINGINDPSTVTPGTELKVLTGPFRAEVNITKSELAIFLNDMYAGSFKVQTGTSPSPSEGTFAIQDKQTARAYYGLDGTTFAAGDPRNPYGQIWMDLGNRLCIHGSPDMQPGASGLGCIQLKTADAKDVYGILSQGSTVTVRR